MGFLLPWEKLPTCVTGPLLLFIDNELYPDRVKTMQATMITDILHIGNK